MMFITDRLVAKEIKALWDARRWAIKNTNKEHALDAYTVILGKAILTRRLTARQASGRLASYTKHPKRHKAAIAIFMEEMK